MSISLFLMLKMATNLEVTEKLNQVTYQESLPDVASSPIKIIVQPLDQTDCKGNKVTYTVLVEGGIGSIHYLWKRKRVSDTGFMAFGAKDSTKLPVYNIGVGVEAPNGTQYQVIVTDQESAVSSTVVSLFVNQIAGIAPIGVATYTINQGDNLAFQVLTTGNNPLSFQWIKKYGSNDWRDLVNNSIISGSQSAQFSLTKISLADSGLYKVRVTFPTLNSNQCIETSSVSRRIYVLPVEDFESPIFMNLPSKSMMLCPDNLGQANWDESISDILPIRKNSYQFHKNDAIFDLSTANFADNITPSTDLILHWGIFLTGNPTTILRDNAGTWLDDIIGQISEHPENIDLEISPDASQEIQIVYWLEDAAGNLTPMEQRHRLTINVHPRPEIISEF